MRLSKPLIVLTVGALLASSILLSACGSSTEALDATTTTIASAPTTDPGATTGEAVIYRYEKMMPPDEAKFLECVREREAERAKAFTDAELITFGNRDCELIIAAKTVVDRQQAELTLQAEMVASGKTSDVASKISSDIRNASVDTLCKRITS